MIHDGFIYLATLMLLAAILVNLPVYLRGKGAQTFFKFAPPIVHIAKLNGRLCGAKRPHSVSEQPNFYQSLQSNPYNDSSHPSGGE